ncbi:MAG TPA: CAP domain-containing protein, partial [Streptomyces sp.]|nr:CAP domain-containing protein [Streptomyces sp.]
MSAVAVASTMVPQPGGSSGTQYSGIQADGPPEQSPDLPSVPSPEGGTETPGNGNGNGGAGDGAGNSVPPDSSQGPGDKPQDPGSSQPSEPGGNTGGSGDTQPSDPDGNGSGKGDGDESGSGSGSGNSGSGESSSTSASTRAEAEVLSLVNDEREDAGCKPVKADRDLTDLAGDFSRDMAVQGFFSHIAPDGSSPWDRADDLGILELGGENIARGQKDAEDVMEAWMDSPGHKAN